VTSLLRYGAALVVAVAVVFALLWLGAWIAELVSQPHREQNDFTVGARLDLCGYQVDTRHAAGGYDLDQWRGERCESLSELDHCILACLADAGTIEIGADCFPDCVAD
jgi:hypothetical protein